MSRDFFVDRSTLLYARDENGDQRMIDGQHRIKAALRAEWRGRWDIQCLWAPHQTAAAMYIRVDTAQSARSAADISRAAGYDSLSETMGGSIVRVAKYLLAWDPDYENPPGTSGPFPEDVSYILTYYEDALHHADAIIASSTTDPTLKDRIKSPMVFTVMAATIHQHGAEAIKFWRNVVNFIGDMPKQLALELIKPRPRNAPPRYYGKVAIRYT